MFRFSRCVSYRAKITVILLPHGLLVDTALYAIIHGEGKAGGKRGGRMHTQYDNYHCNTPKHRGGWQFVSPILVLRIDCIGAITVRRCRGMFLTSIFGYRQLYLAGALCKVYWYVVRNLATWRAEHTLAHLHPGKVSRSRGQHRCTPASVGGPRSTAKERN